MIGRYLGRLGWTHVARLAAVGGPILVVVGAFAAGLASVPGEADRSPALGMTVVDQPAVVAPPARPARSARVRADARVLGVTVKGRHRAYLVAALTPVRQHIINDLIGGVPVSVAYCDRTDCARAYTAPNRSAPLDLTVGGWVEGGELAGLMVRVGPHRYLQQTTQPLDEGAPPFPYAGFEVERSTWGEWRKAHPDTDIYTGDGHPVQ